MCVEGDIEFVCTRGVVVPAADSDTSLGAWNRALQFFETANGPGQGSPDFGRVGGSGHPYSPNGVRHGNDHGQPGGSPAFTIHVTPDMCAEIAACSGGLPHRRPTRIWDAPIDDYAKTAAKILSENTPGVAQAAAAYDAYQRIQNGEDPVDVLMAAGGDAALGLIPGLRTGKRVAKALDKAEDVADAAGDVAEQASKHASTLTPGPHAKAGVPARGPERDFTREERAAVNEIGARTGCHTCGTKDPGTKSGDFIPDHQPPNALNPSGGPQQLYPHCLQCSRRQGGQIRHQQRTEQ